MRLISIVLPIFLVLAFGSFLKKIGFVNDEYVKVSNRLIYYYFLPVLLFYKISTSKVSQILDTKVFLVMLVSVVVMFFLSFLVGKIVKIPEKSYGTFAMNNFRANYAYMGLPVSYYAFGDDGLKIASVLMAFIVPFVSILSVVALNISSGREKNYKKFITDTVFNPLSVACIVGIVFSLIHIKFPLFLGRFFVIVSQITLPLALICIGATLTFSQITVDKKAVFLSSFLKLFGLPLIALALISFLKFDTSALIIKVLIIMLSSPAATVNYVLATAMNGDEKMASATVVVSTGLSIVSYTVWLYVLGLN